MNQVAKPREPWDSMVLVGRVARAHGLRGHVVVNAETDFVAERFHRGAEVWTRANGIEQALTITDARVDGPRPIVGTGPQVFVEPVRVHHLSRIHFPLWVPYRFELAEGLHQLIAEHLR